MLKLPQAFQEKYQKLLGAKEAARFFAALNERPKKAFRLNPLKKQQDISYAKKRAVPGLKNAYYGQVSSRDPEWVSGTIYAQEPAAMFPATLCPLAKNSKVLDLCAAPGGKSTILGQRLSDRGLLLANEISRPRAKILRENLERWGLTNVLLTNERPDILAAKFPAFFDLVLVDAPCSGEGMFRKDPGAIAYWSPKCVLACQKRQQKILTSAVAMTKPGGYLFYSTCTFSPEEDEQVVAWLVKKYSFRIEKLMPPVASDNGQPEWTKSHLPALEKTLRFWPQDNLGEGQFLALLHKTKGRTQTSPQSKIKGRSHGFRQQSYPLNSAEKQLLALVLKDFNLPAGLADWRRTALVHQHHVFVPVLPPCYLAGIKVLSNGVELGLLKKKRFEPSHQLAEILGRERQSKVINLADQKTYLAYLHGEELNLGTNLTGFVLVAFHGLIFSFGKVSTGGVLKNFYPKGLRIAQKEEPND